VQKQGLGNCIAGLGLSTVVDFEKSRHVSDEAVSTIRATLEAAGVELIPENAAAQARDRAIRSPPKHT
jgi:hypothetical protein